MRSEPAPHEFEETWLDDVPDAWRVRVVEVRRRIEKGDPIAALLDASQLYAAAKALNAGEVTGSQGAIDLGQKLLRVAKKLADLAAEKAPLVR